MDDDALLRQYIAHNPPAAHPGDTCLVGSDLKVWIIVRDLKAAWGNVLQVAADHGLPRDAVVAARTYYFRHAAVIDARIAAETRPRGDGRRAA
jgi:uncharacterized protein (DUF433 family)